MRKHVAHALLLWVCLTVTTVAGAADVRIASWNIQNLGHGQHKDYAALTAIARRFDFIAVQEVRTAEGIERLQRELRAATGQPWEVMYSHLIGRSTHREKYAFLWNNAVVEYVDGAVVFLDTTDRFAREPYSARFRVRGSDFQFVAATVHIVYGRSVGDRTPEIHALREYWDWLPEVYGDTPRLLMGDFNLAPTHPAWAELWEVAEPLITSGATTLSSIDGRYANLYDTIIVQRGHRLPVTEAGILRFPEILKLNHEDSRRRVSDHAPVYLLLGSARLNVGAAALQPQTAAACIDLNHASRQELARIVHIGEERAQAIVDGRPWRSVDQLQRIDGIGPARLRDIKAEGAVCGG